MPENGLRRSVDVLYGVSDLPIIAAPQSLPAKPRKLLRENSAPLTTSLVFDVVSLVPGVAEMSMPASSCQMKLRSSSISGCLPRTPMYDRLVEIEGCQPILPTGTPPLSP